MAKADDTANGHGRQRVLILSAAVAGGHEAMAQNLKAALEEAGQTAVVTDGLALMGRYLNWFLISAYAWELRHAPWLCGVTFRLTGFRPSVLASRALIGWLCVRRLARVIEREQPDLIVSTYPVVTAGLGRLAKAGRLRQPVFAAITDYGAHAMWASPDIDLHFVLSPQSAEMVARTGGRARVARLPVARGFPARASRGQARASLEIDRNAFVVLIVGGAWGIGDIEGPAECALAAGAFPIIVTGQNEELRRRLAARFHATPAVRVIGWTDQMPLLMAAADCVIQNAGGVTCLEALEVGLPIIFFRPIPGHGELNMRVMAAAGAALEARDPEALRALLRGAVSGRRPLEPARPPLRCETVETMLTWSPPRPRSAPPRGRPVLRPVIAAALLMLLGWTILSPWGMALANESRWHRVVGTNVPPGSVAVAVRVHDPATAHALEHWIDQDGAPLALFVDVAAASGLVAGSPTVIGALEDPSGNRLAAPWNLWDQTHAASDAVRRVTGSSPRYFLPQAGELDAVDLTLAPRHARLVAVASGAVDRGHGGIVAIETSGLDATAAVAAVKAQLGAIERQGGRAVPLTSLP